MAVGTSDGAVQLVSVEGLSLVRDWTVHGAAVRCLEWGGPHHIVSAAYTPTLSTSAVVRNEVRRRDDSSRLLISQTSFSALQVVMNC